MKVKERKIKKARTYTDRTEARKAFNDFVNSKPEGFVFKVSDVCDLFKNDKTLKNVGNLHSLVHTFINSNKKVERVTRGFYGIKKTDVKESVITSNIPKINQLLLSEINKTSYMTGGEYYLEMFVLNAEQVMNRKLLQDEVDTIQNFLDNPDYFTPVEDGGYTPTSIKRRIQLSPPTPSEVKEESPSSSGDTKETNDGVGDEVYSIFLQGYLSSTQLDIGEHLDPSRIFNGLKEYLAVFPNEEVGIELTKETFKNYDSVVELYGKFYYKQVPMIVTLKF